MTKPTNYQLLKDVHEAINRLEDKMDKRVTSLETRTDSLEDFRSRALGIAGIVGAISSFTVSWLYKRLTSEG